MTSKLVYWVDRSLGAHIVPKALSDHGINIRTYAEIYPNDDTVPDHVWIPEIAGRGWVIRTKDKDIPSLLSLFRWSCPDTNHPFG